LKEVSDLERLIGRVSLGSATPRDLVAMLRSLNQVPEIRLVLAEMDSSLLEVLAENSDELLDVRELIGKAISEDPPVSPGPGGCAASPAVCFRIPPVPSPF
jgi:DNA mismatch repair protein MutS